jgi:hypothetical protein
MAGINKNSKKHIEADPLIIPDSFEGYPLTYFKYNYICFYFLKSI